MTDQLTLYNGCLRVCGVRQLATLTDDTQSRYEIDSIWDDGWVQGCLEEGLWHHAMRTMGLTYSPSVEPPFGLRYAFDKPTDLVRIAAICSDEWFTQPIIQLQDDANFWFCDLTTIYIRYVSNDPAYGMDMSLWPQTFVKMVEAQGAVQVIERLKDSDQDLDRVTKIYMTARTNAKAKDAQKESPQFPPEGAWNKARRGWGNSYRPYGSGWGC